MLTTVKIDNRMNGFLGIPDRPGKKPVVNNSCFVWKS